MPFYAIRHKPSGGFLPALNSYGFTQAKPSMVDPPRIFKRKASATQSLDWWLQGIATPGYVDNEFGGEATIRVLPQTDRIAAHMEIVEVKMTFRTLEQAELEKL